MYVKREIQVQFRKLSPIYPILAVVGPRQAGKTTFLKAEIKDKSANYLLFDDPDIRELFNEDIKKFERQYVEGKEIIALDEVQYGSDPGQKLKYLADTGNKLWITASSEILLSKNVLSYLVGRVSILRLYPFSLREFLDYKNVKETTPHIIERESEEHALYGGYPKVVTTADREIKQTILRDLFETMMLKDVARNFSIQDIAALEKFGQFLAINAGAQLSYETIAQIIKISYATIQKYLDAMEKSYFILRVKPFFTNKNKELSKREKIYLMDTGLRNSVARSFIFDGRVFENYVATELLKLGFTPKYWMAKTKVEVDFIIEKDNETIPIEVKMTEEKIGRGMHSFIDEYEPKRAYVIIHKGKEKAMKKNGCTIHFIRIDKLKEELEK
ncbi:MAG: ATP-binding protein [Nanoarchaeota archaeon]